MVHLSKWKEGKELAEDVEEEEGSEVEEEEGANSWNGADEGVRGVRSEEVGADTDQYGGATHPQNIGSHY